MDITIGVAVILLALCILATNVHINFMRTSLSGHIIKLEQDAVSRDVASDIDRRMRMLECGQNGHEHTYTGLVSGHVDSKYGLLHKWECTCGHKILKWSIRLTAAEKKAIVELNKK